GAKGGPALLVTRDRGRAPNRRSGIGPGHPPRRRQAAAPSRQRRGPEAVSRAALAFCVLVVHPLLTGWHGAVVPATQPGKLSGVRAGGPEVSAGSTGGGRRGGGEGRPRRWRSRAASRPAGRGAVSKKFRRVAPRRRLSPRPAPAPPARGGAGRTCR